MRGDDKPEAGWDAVTAVLERAVASLPARAAPAVTMTSPDAGRPPFGPGTTLRVLRIGYTVNAFSNRSPADRLRRDDDGFATVPCTSGDDQSRQLVTSVR